MCKAGNLLLGYDTIPGPYIHTWADHKGCPKPFRWHHVSAPGSGSPPAAPDDNYFRVDLQQHLLYFEPLTAGIPPGGLEAYGVYQCNYIRGGLRTMDREGHAYRVTLHGECATQLADPTAAAQRLRLFSLRVLLVSKIPNNFLFPLLRRLGVIDDFF